MTAPTYPDIAAFLSAQLDEREAKLRAAICPCGGPVCNIETGWYKEHELLYRFDVIELEVKTEEAYQEELAAARAEPHNAIHTVDFILDNTPARVLADIAAKRAIVAEYVRLCDDADMQIQGAVARFLLVHPLICHLAAPFSDQPGYRPEWAVG